jgi:hypothetical protein
VLLNLRQTASSGYDLQKHFNSLLTFSVESGGRLTLWEYMTFAASQVGGLVANTTIVILVSSALTVPIAKLLALVVGF